MVHLYFNIIGTVLFLVLFYGINAFVHFPFLETSANAAGIAIVHSGFNIFATLILFPFADGLQVAIDAGATACIQPGGSIRDEEVIAAADAAGIAMVFTGHRHFLH